MYPEALHSKTDYSGRNRIVTGKVKEVVEGTLSEFLQKGTYHGKPLSYKGENCDKVVCPERNGKYYLFAIIKSERGMSRLLNPFANILAKDDYASNLYFHMADELFSRLLFHNPILPKIEDVSLDIATRSSDDLSASDPLYMEYKNLGYEERRSRRTGKSYFPLTNIDVYRSVLADEIIRTGKTDFHLSSFDVRPIRYKVNSSGYEFLYLADSLCSYLCHKLTEDSADKWIQEISSRADALTGSEANLVFAYDEIDFIYQKAWKCYEEGDYYQALSFIYDGIRRDGEVSRYYKQSWFQRLSEKISVSENESALRLAVQKLHYSICSNRFDQDKSIFIHKILEKAVERIAEHLHTAEARRVLYQLYDSGMSVYTHIGDSKKAEHYFDKCTETVGFAELESYLNTRNRMIVSCCDVFELERAKGLSEENLFYQKMLSDMKQEIHLIDTREEGTVTLGKAYSQDAQVLAFCRDETAEEQFRRALRCFDPDSANYRITQSYLLHFYLDQYRTGKYGDSFQKESIQYFGGHEDLLEQLDYIIEESTQPDPLINIKYALYVFTRSIYRHRLRDVTRPLLERLRSLEKIISKKLNEEKWTLNGHPSELIFLYLSLIETAVGNMKYARKFESRIDTCLVYKGTTIEAICMNAHIQCAQAHEDLTKRDQLISELCAYLLEHFDVFKDLQIPQDSNQRFQWINDKITFMYC